MKKVENYKLIKTWNFLKVYWKWKKTVIKFGEIEIEKQKFHQCKRPISMKNIDINKLVVLNKVSFCKNGFKYFMGYKDAKKLDLNPFFIPKLVHIEETLMKLTICLFW